VDDAVAAFRDCARLGMDYDIFLTTRIREEVSKGKTDEQAIVTS